MKPYRIDLSFTATAEDIEAICALMDRVSDYGENLDLLYEDSFVHEMKAEDVIEDSPLARKLAA